MAGLNAHVHFFSKLYLSAYYAQHTGWGFRVEEGDEHEHGKNMVLFLQCPYELAV